MLSTPVTSLDVCAVLAHGFTNHIGTGHVRAIAHGLSGQGLGVLAYDARGHGRSGGHSTVGDLEPLDLEKAATPELIVRLARQIRSLVPA